MDNSLKGLILAAGIIITCVVVGLGFYVSRETKNTSSNGIDQIMSMNSEYQDVEKTLYDGLTISGREVLETLEKFKDELVNGTLTITVYTGGNPKKEASGVISGGKKYGKSGSAGSEYNYNADILCATSKGGNDYINPNASFEGDVTYDANQVINGLVFTQN